MANNGTRLGLVAAVTGLLLTGCGGGGGGSAEATTTEASANARVVEAGLEQPRGCFLTVFLAHDVTPKQQQHVQTLMVRSKRVRTVSFVSKELALERFAQRKPEVAAGMSQNLFPDAFEVVPRSRLDVYPIILDFAPGVPGVINVRASTPCGRA
jgi:cell division protein FtsX